MVCPKCGCENVNITAVTETKSKTRWGCGCLFTWLAFLFPKRVSKTHTEAICQNCGNRWKVSASEIKRNAQTVQALPGGNVVSKLHTPEEPFYKRLWFLVVSGLIFPPLGIALVWLVYKNWDTKKKAVISGIMALWFIILLCSNGNKSSNEENGSGNLETTPYSSTKSLAADAAFTGITSWEDSAEQVLSSCEVGYASVLTDGYGPSLSVFVTEVEDIDPFMLTASIYPSLIVSPPSSLDRLKSVIIYFEDSSIFITLDESFSVPLARSSLLVDESSDSYQEIKTAYDTYFSPYKID